jgi:hypothetical protein
MEHHKKQLFFQKYSSLKYTTTKDIDKTVPFELNLKNAAM